MNTQKLSPISGGECQLPRENHIQICWYVDSQSGAKFEYFELF